MLSDDRKRPRKIALSLALGLRLGLAASTVPIIAYKPEKTDG